MHFAAVVSFIAGVLLAPALMMLVVREARSKPGRRKNRG
jgi:hypothetical protein